MIEDALERWRTAPAGLARDRAWDALAREVRTAMTSRLRLLRASHDVQDDCAQNATTSFLEALQLGRLQPGKESSYASVVARNALCDYRRASSRRAKHEVQEQDPALLAVDPAPTAEQRLFAATERRELSGHLESLPKRYRDLLVAVYLEERSVGELADVECGQQARELGRPLEPQERARVRNTVDQGLSRARRALQQRLAEAAAQRGG